MDRSILLPTVQRSLEKYGIIAEVLQCDPELADTAAFCAHYGFSLSQSANTILVASRRVDPPKYALCIVLATTRLDVNKKVCELLGVKKASFADAETTRHLTGMEIGGVVAVGIENLPIYVDSAVMEQQMVVMGGGNRSSKLVLDPGELRKLAGAEIVEGLAKPKADS